MREIEFRFYDKRIDAMRQVTKIDFYNRYVYWFCKITVGFNVRQNLDKMELSQFTGIKDKYGKKVYEGDIVYFENYVAPSDGFELGYFKGVVEFLEGEWLVNNVKSKDALGLWSETEQVTIIGNKWQNPELLEAE